MNIPEVEWIQAAFFVEMLVISWILMIPMRKREHYIKRAIFYTAIGLFIAAADSNTNVKFIFETMMSGFIIFRLYVISWRKAVYTVVCAYAVQHLSYTVGMTWKCLKGMVLKIPSTVL